MSNKKSFSETKTLAQKTQLWPCKFYFTVACSKEVIAKTVKYKS